MLRSMNNHPLVQKKKDCSLKIFSNLFHRQSGKINISILVCQSDISEQLPYAVLRKLDVHKWGKITTYYLHYHSNILKDR